jgi:septal ring factor EnvC (AmiA/AmiB activator)
MSMIDPHSEPRTGQDLVNWLHDQVGALKAQLARMQQQHDQSQAALLDVNEKLRDAEARTRDVASRTMGLSVMQDQVRQLAGLLSALRTLRCSLTRSSRCRTHATEERLATSPRRIYRRAGSGASD